MRLPSILAGVLVVAAVSTLADFLWYELGVEHRMVSGVLHGVALLTAVGGVLGAAAGRLVAGLPLGMTAGLGGALVYYALVPAIGQGATIAAWAVLWVMLAFLDGKLLRRGERRAPEILLRGSIAATIGGLAFYLVVEILWGRLPTRGLDYLVQLAAWAFAWAPGLVALTWSPRESA